MIIDIFLNYLIVHIKFSMKYYYFILKLKRSFVYAVFSLSLFFFLPLSLTFSSLGSTENCQQRGKGEGCATRRK